VAAVRPRLLRVLAALLLGAALTTLPACAAHASGTEIAMFEDDGAMAANPGDTFFQLRMLGVQRVRVPLRWASVSPDTNSARAPRNFNASNPASYPAGAWAALDTIVRDAQGNDMGLDLDLTGGAPRWAFGPGRPAGSTNPNWEPSPSMFQAFVHAVGVRYSGNYNPRTKRLAPGNPNDLPRVSFWSVWNEPNYGPSLAPQGVPGDLTVPDSPRMYRNLVDAAWRGLAQTGHHGDTFIFGELADRGFPYWGVFSGMTPVFFIQAMYCLNSSYRELRGSQAAFEGCPTTASASRRFRAQNPALFKASGVSDHPYMRWYPPNREEQPNPDYASLAQIGNLERALNRVQGAYGSGRRLPVWDTEFGYITTPPKHDNQYEPTKPHYEPWISQTTAAYYLNWAEYISWRDPRIASFFQYLLRDTVPANKSTDWGGYASGLFNYNGTPKATYNAWRLPLYLPVTSTRHGHSVRVWGCIRPAHYAILDTGDAQTGEIQFQQGSRGRFTTLKTITISGSSASCYFDSPVTFPSSGTVRLSWSYPLSDPLLGDLGPKSARVAYSRDVKVTVR
jgi:hypothetical protein